MKIHTLKIKYEYLLDILKGNKTFELRKNDRDFQEGDYIKFINTDGGDYIVLVDEETKTQYWLYNDNDLFRITYVLKDVPEYGLDKDYCILGIKRCKIELY